MRRYSLIFSVLTALVLISAGGLQPVFAQSFQSGGNPVLNRGNQPILNSQSTGTHLVKNENFQQERFKSSLFFQNTYIKRADLLQNTHLHLRRYRFNLRQVGRFLQPDPMGYTDSMNMYQSFNQNPVNFVDPMGKQYQITVTPQGSKSERNMTVGEYWNFLRKDCSFNIKDSLDMIAHSPSYSKYFWDGSLVDRIKTHNKDFTLSNSEARAMGVEYAVTFKGPREQLGRLFRGEFKEFGETALNNIQRTVDDPENLALMFMGGVKYGVPKSSTAVVHYNTYWSNMGKVLDYRKTGNGYIPALPASPTSLTINQVRNLRGKRRWQASENYIQELYGSSGQKHYQVPVEGNITGTGGRFVDAPVNTPNGVIANEVKMYQMWTTIKGTPTQNKVPLSSSINQQILKDLWLRENLSGYDPRWLFLDAPPSIELATQLSKNGIIYIIYK